MLTRSHRPSRMADKAGGRLITLETFIIDSFTRITEDGHETAIGEMQVRTESLIEVYSAGDGSATGPDIEGSADDPDGWRRYVRCVVLPVLSLTAVQMEGGQ